MIGTRRRLRVRAAAPLLAPALVLALATGLAGCGGNDGGGRVATAGDKSPGRGSKSPGDDEERARRYADCMRDAGVVMTETDQGLPQVDKEHTPVGKLSAAAEKCRDVQPGASAPPRLSPEDVEKRGRYAACIRAHGVPDYPDPDPRTGVSEMSDELARRLKGDPKMRSALESCRNILPRSAGGAVNGG